MQGIAKARDCGFIDAGGGTWRFDLAEYEHYEQVQKACTERTWRSQWHDLSHHQAGED